MKSRQSHWQVGLIIVLVLAVLLSACGPTEAPPEPAAPTQEAVAPTEAPAEEAAEEPAATEAPVEEPAPAPEASVITYAYPRTISTLDPSLVLSSENNVLWNVWGNLTLWDPDEGVIPFIAESWESNEDATEWTFHLHEGVKCHDGSDFTAEDVKFSWERTIEAGALAYVFAMVDTIEVVDPVTVKVNLLYPFKMDANAANSWGPYLMCKNVADKDPEWFAAGNENGVGPYTIESFEPGQRMVLQRFEGWFGEWPAGAFDTVVIEIIEDGAVRAQKLRAGEADIAWGISYDDFESLNATDEVTAFAIPAFQQLQWHFNMRRAPLDDLRVRQALAHSFPYGDAQIGTFGGFGTVAEGAVPRVQWEPPVQTRVYEYDLDKAKALLEEAGVPEGTEFRLGVEVNAVEEIKTAELWQAALAQIGINLIVEKISSGVRWDEVYNPETEFDIMLMHMIIGFDSPNEYLGSLWHSGWTWYPFSGFESDEFNGLVEEALSLEAVDQGQSDDLYQQAEQILFDEAVGVFALDLPQDWAVANDVHSFKPNPLYGYDVFFWQMGRGEPGEVAPPPEPTEAPAEEPSVTGGVITYAYPRTISTLDPSLVLSSENNVLWNVWGNLTLWDPDEGVIPFIAESWESNEDATEWTFHLHEGVKCHDGSDFTAEDVKFSWERTIEAGALAYVFAMVDTIEVVDPVTVKVNLLYPFKMDANAANSWGPYLMCKNVADKDPEWFAAGNENGVGPYTIESFEPGQRMVLQRFEGWFGEWPAGAFDTVVIEIIEDGAVRAQKLRAGEADIAWGISYDDFESLNATDEVTAFAIPAFQQLQWHFNMRRAPLDDLRVRQALAHSFPYGDAQIGTFGGFGTVAEGAVPRVQWEPPVQTRVYEYDLDKAKALLEEAGVPEGTEFRLGVEVNAVEEIKTAELWQAALAQIGINLIVEKISSGVRWDEVYNPETEFDIMLMHMIIGFDSPNEYLGSLWHSGWTWYPFSGFESDEFNGLVEEALSLEAVDQGQSDDLYQQAEQILFDEAVGVFALDLPQDWAVANDVHSFKPNPLYGYDVFFWQMGRQ